MSSSRLTKNPLHAPDRVRSYDKQSRAFHESLPGYSPTSLRELPTVARELGVRAVYVKDESTRIGTPSFKILGASWATYRVLLDHLGIDVSVKLSLSDLRAELASSSKDLSLVAATDGNHGRAVAVMGRLLDLPVHILVPEDMVQERVAAIESEGATVEVVAGGYDDAIKRSAEVAGPETLVVSDTSWEGYTQPPAWVIDGYSTMINEIVEAIDTGQGLRPTVVAAQIGVGAFAAAVARGFGRIEGIKLVGVEPTRADCVITSIEKGEVTAIAGPQNSIMAGLNCGTPSEIAWDDLAYGFDVFVTTTDDDARQAMRLLAQDGIISGESGAAGLAGLLAHCDGLGLDTDDVVLLFSTEGATDMSAYREIVGEVSK